MDRLDWWTDVYIDEWLGCWWLIGLKRIDSITVTILSHNKLLKFHEFRLTISSWKIPGALITALSLKVFRTNGASPSSFCILKILSTANAPNKRTKRYVLTSLLLTDLTILNVKLFGVWPISCGMTYCWPWLFLHYSDIPTVTYFEVLIIRSLNPPLWTSYLCHVLFPNLLFSPTLLPICLLLKAVFQNV